MRPIYTHISFPIHADDTSKIPITMLQHQVQTIGGAFYDYSPTFSHFFYEVTLLAPRLMPGETSAL